jgi:hypothetical protein
MLNAPKRPENDHVIWRYISLDKYLDLLLTESIKFTQVDIAADQLEISLMLNTLEKSGKLIGKEYIADGANFHVDILRKSHYISCWTGKEHECRSLWFAYLGESRIGVAIKTNVGKFIQSIDWGDFGFDYRKVDYRNVFEDTEELQVNTTLLNVKAPAYASESEIRFTINKNLIEIPDGELSELNPPRQVPIESLPKVIALKVDLAKLIDEVWVSPYCQSWQLETIKSLTDKLAPDANLKLRRSDLNERI